jgi:hypothetical protein
VVDGSQYLIGSSSSSVQLLAKLDDATTHAVGNAVAR